MIIGTCSKCKGPVEVPDVWLCILPAVPTCVNCGSVKKNPYGPIIEMEYDEMVCKTIQELKEKSNKVRDDDER